MPASSSVIIVSYRPGDWLAEAIASVVDQADQVVVVDNASNAAAASTIARELGATVVRSAVNRGFAGGVALGLAGASGEIIGVLNDDATAGPGWLASAGRLLEDPSLAAVTPKVVLAAAFAEVVVDDPVWHAPGDARDLGRQLRSVTVDGEERLEQLVGAGVHHLESAADPDQPSAWRWTAGPRPFYVPVPQSGEAPTIRVDGEEVTPTRREVRLLNHAGSFLLDHGVAGEHGYAAPDDGRFDAPREVFGFSATAPVFRAETLHRLGAFAEPFFAYNEDTDWCLRAHLNGLRIVYDPAATVRHRLSATSGGAASRRVQLLAQRNALLCLARNAPRRVAARYLLRRGIEGPGDGVRAAVARRLPWAVATRAAMARSWQRSPEEVWRQWVGVGSTWDTAAARCGA